MVQVSSLNLERVVSAVAVRDFYYPQLSIAKVRDQLLRKKFRKMNKKNNSFWAGFTNLKFLYTTKEDNSSEAPPSTKGARLEDNSLHQYAITHN